MTKITRSDITDIVQHWLETPVEGYLGSDYGSDLKALLQTPQTADGSADAVIQKLRSDVQVLSVLPSGAVNLYAVPQGFDKVQIVLDVAGNAIELKG